ncbi:alpha-amylase family protein [Microbacterium sp. BK668]|uniref:alpha-amylase family protein n=1 Tax=Microbacterium sp. BK668 TaxID=2512118 RepID=UPI00105DA59B|nr:alpha-amylase family protein [Microbacterium sp. BK668]TDN90677.1 trehalose synthase [Microbacterium sp. BK668]
MRLADTGDLWWRSAVVYCLDVETYRDGDGDGVGDFTGLTESIPYLEQLGITCIWLMPFYPSPDLDDGYDVSDFYAVDPRLGSLGDAVEFIRTARSRGIRVIIDLVVNHTSDKHPWFVQAKRSRNSRFRDFYVWRDRPTRNSKNTVFPGEEESIWEWEPKTEQYYLHSFYTHQPDLNLANPHVRDEISKIVAFWLALGISGFRIDAVPFLLEGEGAPYPVDPHEFLRDLKRFVRRRSSEAMLLGEVALPHDRQLDYFGGPHGGELDAQFDFTLMNALYLAMVRRDAEPILRSLRSRPSTSEPVTWGNFLRNHDELTLQMLGDDEKEEVFAAFAPDAEQRIYGRGILRRLAPMLDGDPRRLQLAYSLMFSLPGCPVLYYGEEIGMGENADLPGRATVRSPMQWAPARNGGFSTAPPSRLPNALTAGGYGPDHVNVRNQQMDEESLFHFIRALIARYRTTPEIGWGDCEIVEHPNPGVLAHILRTDGEGGMLALHNLTAEPQTVALPTSTDLGGEVLTDMLHLHEIALDPQRSTDVELGPYGFQWLQITPPGGAIV